MENKKNKGTKLVVLIIIGILLIIIFGLQVFATVRGEKNLFFMIKNMVNPANASGTEDIFYDFEEAEEINESYNENNNEFLNENQENANNEKAQGVVEKYFEIITQASSNTFSLLETLELKAGDGIEAIEVENGQFYKTNIEYTEFENKVSEYMTKDCAEKALSEYVKNVDGYLYIIINGGSNVHYEIKDFEFVKSDNNNFEFKAKLVLYTADHADLTEDELTPKNMLCNLEIENGRYLVSTIEY